MNQNLVTLASACYELDYEIVLNSKYGEKLFAKKTDGQVFSNKMLIINNVNERKKVENYAENAVKNNLITEFYFVEDYNQKALANLGINGVSRESFKEKKWEKFLKKVEHDGYISSIPAITAILKCKTKYLLYLDEDATLDEIGSKNWINEAILLMYKDERYVVANPVWNKKTDEAKAESLSEIEMFYISQGFSNQCFLIDVEKIRTEFDFNESTPRILKEKYPVYAGNCFERRFATYMLNHNLYRLTAKTANYSHKDFTKDDIEFWKNQKLV